MHVVRLVLPTEYHKYRTHLKALDTRSRHLRFATNVSDEFIDRFCDSIEDNKSDHVLFGIENSTLDFVGMGHVVLSTNELAMSVLPQYQNQKMGSAILERILQYCRTKNILSGYMICLQTNHAIRHLCQKYHVKIEADYGELSGEVTLDQANLGTHLNEAAAMTRGVIDYTQKRFWLPWSIIADATIQSLTPQKDQGVICPISLTPPPLEH